MAIDFVAIGTSLGGMRALHILLAALPADFQVPIAIVIHRHKEARELGAVLALRSSLPVVEIVDKTPIQPGQVYLAPADYHTMIEGGHFALDTDGPVAYARPSIDVLFCTAAEAFMDRLLGVLLTGSNQDGAVGIARIKDLGGLVIVQDPATAESSIMPAAALTAVQVDHVVPLAGIAPLLVELCPRY